MSDETMQDIAVATLTGSVIDNSLRIEEVIGQGGMSTVYRAHHLKMGIDVAVKVLHKHLSSDASHLKRFQLEAKAMAMLEHPHICRVLYSSEHNGCPYLVMELLQGSNLKEHMQKARFDNRTVIAITNQIASALHYAHSQGVVHRDLKPTNVFVQNDDQDTLKIKIMDFGIARFLESGDTKLTATNVFVGSPTYMSPEQCTTHDTDKRSDIYALGCLLFEMLEGSPPFTGETPMEVMHKHVYDPVPSFKNGHTTKERKVLEGIALKCLQKKPESRFQDTQEITLALQRITDSGLLLSLRQSTPAPNAVLLLLAVALLGATLFLIQWQTAQEEKLAAPKLDFPHTTPFKQIDQAVEMSHHPERYSQAQVEQAFQIVLQNNPKSARSFWAKANFLYAFYLSQSGQVERARPYYREAVAEALNSHEDEVRRSYFQYLTQLAVCEAHLAEGRKRSLAEKRRSKEWIAQETREMNSYAQSAEQHARAVVKGSIHSGCLQGAADVLRLLGKIEDAKKAYGLAITVLEHEGDDGESLYYNRLRRGHCEQDLRNYKAARKNFAEAIEALSGLAPERRAQLHFDINEYIILTYIAEGDFKSANRIFVENSALINQAPVGRQLQMHLKNVYDHTLIAFYQKDYKSATKYGQDYLAQLSASPQVTHDLKDATAHVNNILAASKPFSRK